MMSILFSALAAFITASAAHAQTKADSNPVVVELFTSQGCSACPKANEMLGEFSVRDDVIGLAFAVDYWDYLGWRDTFAKPEFVARQRKYATHLRNRGVYTPQMVIDGRLNVPGLDSGKVESAIGRAKAMAAAGPRIEVAVIPKETALVQVGGGDPSVDLVARPTGAVSIKIEGGDAAAEPADVWMIAYLAGRRDVAVAEGENKGKSVAHFNMVTSLERLGDWTGDPVEFQARIASGESVVVLVQEQGLGPIRSVGQGALLGSTTAAVPTSFDGPD